MSAKKLTKKELRELIDTELCSRGQRLRRNNTIVQTHDEDCMMMVLSRPRVIEWDVDIHALAKKLGLLK
jgi:hypothetical protein